MIMDASRSSVVKCHAIAPTVVLGRDWIHYQDTWTRRAATGACFLALAKTKPIRIFGPAFVRDCHTQATLYSSVRTATLASLPKLPSNTCTPEGSYIPLFWTSCRISLRGRIQRRFGGSPLAASALHLLATRAKLVRALFSSHSVTACFESILVILEFLLRKLAFNLRELTIGTWCDTAAPRASYSIQLITAVDTRQRLRDSERGRQLSTRVDGGCLVEREALRQSSSVVEELSAALELLISLLARRNVEISSERGAVRHRRSYMLAAARRRSTDSMTDLPESIEPLEFQRSSKRLLRLRCAVTSTRLLVSVHPIPDVCRQAGAARTPPALTSWLPHSAQARPDRTSGTSPGRALLVPTSYRQSLRILELITATALLIAMRCTLAAPPLCVRPLSCPPRRLSRLNHYLRATALLLSLTFSRTPAQRSTSQARYLASCLICRTSPPSSGR